MQPYEWMAQDTPQKLWIDGKGVLVWFAEVFGALGGGLYVVSLYFNSLEGMFISWLVVVTLKCGFHFAHLGRPFRVWRLALKPRTSWLARGFIFLALFIGFGAVQLAISLWLPGTAWEVVFKVATGIMAILVAAYTGFVMNYVNGIPFWNSAVLPLLFVSFGVLGGLAVITVIAVLGAHVDIRAVVAGIRLLLVVNALLMVTYLWSATYMGPTGKRSVEELVRGYLAPVLWGGVVLCGIVIPFGIVSFYHFVGVATVPLLIVVACVMIGVFSLNYCLLKGALYRPLIPTST